MFPDKLLIQIAMVAFKALCACVVSVCFLLTVFAVGPAVEQRFFPIVSKLHVLNVKELSDGRFLWSRDNSSRYVAWKTTGRPFLVGVYDRRCQMPIIANDVLFVAGAQ